MNWISRIIFTFIQVLLVLLIFTGGYNTAVAVELPLHPVLPSNSGYSYPIPVNNSTALATGQPVHPRTSKIKLSRKFAVQLARYHWLDKAAVENPEIIEAITRYPKASAILAQHPRLGNIAEVDHYLCRQLAKWRSAAMLLSSNGEADQVIALDPDGIYQAIKRYPKVIQHLTKNPSFYQILEDNPEIGRIIANH